MTNPFLGFSATQVVIGGGINLDTTDVQSESAGYFSSAPLFGEHPSMPVLDRVIGFTIMFEVKIVGESHSSTDRVGFSMIVTSEDLIGLELGFWRDEIWTQNDNPLFTHAEGVSFDTTGSLIRYDLTVLNSGYTLFADGSPIFIISYVTTPLSPIRYLTSLTKHRGSSFLAMILPLLQQQSILPLFL